MAKVIKMTPEMEAEAKQEFAEALKRMKLSDGKITYSKHWGTVDRKATLYFTELAYLKMCTLVRDFTSEVGWHGVAVRGDDPEKDEYIVKDIIVYPQIVTGANVEPDQTEYEMWLMQQPDEVFNNIRFQGHSHVNMPVSPSTVDLNLYGRILDQLEDDMFYVFLIWNKQNQKMIKIYDMAKNVLFETQDVTVSVLDDGTGVEHFLKEAKKLVQPKKYTPQPYMSTTKPGHTVTQKTTAADMAVPKTPAAPTTASTPIPINSGKDGKKKKGKKRKKGFRRSGAYVGGYDMGGYPYGVDDDDDYDDPNGPFGYRDGLIY